MNDIIDFGQYKGQSFLKVPIGYLVFIETQINKDKINKKTYNKKRLKIIEHWLEERYLENDSYDKKKEWNIENQKSIKNSEKKVKEASVDIPEEIAIFIINTYGYDFSDKIAKEMEKQIKFNIFDNQEFTTLEKYFNLYPDKKDAISSILKECGTMGGLSESSRYIIENEHTTLIFSYFREITYKVDAIYTIEEHRQKSSAKRLLSSLNFIGSLYFDTKVTPLIHLLKNIGAHEVKVFQNKSSTQLILEVG